MSSTTEYRFLQALDVLFLRGNKLFGDPGSFGESLVPPWPSVAAGALRTRLLVDDGFDLNAFAHGHQPHPTLGTPQQPGAFAITHFGLGQLNAAGEVESLTQLPGDLVVTEDNGHVADVSLLQPRTLSHGIQSSACTPMLPILAQTKRGKAASGYWLTATGYAQYLAGQKPANNTLRKSSELWRIENRVGVGLDATTHRAADGQLFSMQAVSLRPEIGFIVGATGATLPKQGMLRLGGDGRAAAISPAAVRPVAPPPTDQLIKAGRARMVLTSPGIFEAGWLPHGVTQNDAGEWRLTLPGLSARLMASFVPKAETVSGWDLAHKQPKPAQLAAPAGTVYWLDQLQSTAEAMGKLAETGLWPEAGDTATHPTRRAEGFNRFNWAAWL